MIVGTAGHIDHGKTALVRALTGIDTARLEEEKRRGITIDLGFAYKPLPDGSVLGFVDVPGHERFVHNMLAGAGGVNFGLLVVAADDGPMPQTVEHASILGLLGLNRGVVALTKCDRVEPDRLAVVSEQVLALLHGTALAGYPIMPVSALTGMGIAELDRLLSDTVMAIAVGPPRGNFRLAVDRCFTLAGAGTVVTGMVYSGAVSLGDRLLVSPGGAQVRVRGIHAQNQPAGLGMTGQRCALNLAGRDPGRLALSRGDWIVASAVHAPTSHIDVTLQVLADEARALRHWTPVHVHLGTTFAVARVAVLDGHVIAPGSSARAQLVLDRSIGACHGDRFIIRDQSAQRTLGGGRVIDPAPPARGRKTAARLAILDAMGSSVLDSTGQSAQASTSPTAVAAALCALLAVCDGGIELASFARRYNLTPAEANEMFDSVPMIPLALSGAVFGFAPQRVAALEASLIETLGRYHQAHPDLAGAASWQLRRWLPSQDISGDGLALVGRVAERLVDGDRVLRRGALYCLPTHRPQVSATERRLRDRILPVLRSSGLKPARVPELARGSDSAESLVRMVLGRLVSEGEVYRVNEQCYFSRAAVAELARRTQTILASEPDGTADINALREGLGMGRNLLIELLEFFDRRGFTSRVSHGRRLRRDCAAVFGLAHSMPPAGKP